MIMQGTIGVVVTVEVTRDRAALDISAATTKNILLRKPSGELLTKAGAFVTDGSDGLINYTTIAGDLDEHGTWQIAAEIEIPGWEGQTQNRPFEVFPILA